MPRLTVPRRIAVRLKGRQPIDLELRLALLRGAARRWLPFDRADEIARNAVGPLVRGTRTDVVGLVLELIAHRRKHFGLEMNEHEASKCAEEMAEAWRRNTL